MKCLLIGGYRIESPEITAKQAAMIQKSNIPLRYVHSKYSRICFELAQTAAHMERHNIEIRLISLFEEEQDIKEEELHDISYVCILTRYFENIYQYIHIITKLKSINPSIRIIIGGGFIVNALKKLNQREINRLFLLMGVDYCINKYDCYSEAADIIATDGNFNKLNTINNIYYKINEQYVITNISNEGITPHVPINWSKYNKLVQPFHSMRTTISCPFECSFCAVKSRTERFTLIEIDKIVNEIKSLQKLDKVQIINFTDETINLPRARFKQLLERIKEFNIKWCSFLRCEYIDEEIVALLKESGCMAVLLGVESGSDRMLNLMNKRTTTKKIDNGIRLLHEYEVLSFGFFIVGFPTEDNQSIQNTIDFINNSKLSFFKIHKWACEFGTSIWSQREKYNIIYKNDYWKHSTMDSIEADNRIERIYRETKVPALKQLDFALILQLIAGGADINMLKQILRNFNEEL